MIAVTIIYKNDNETKNETILEKLRTVSYICDIKHTLNEDYEKLKNTQRIIMNIETSIELDSQEAKSFLCIFSENWEWDDDNSSAWSDKRKHGEFSIRDIEFMDCWFEDLEHNY